MRLKWRSWTWSATKWSRSQLSSWWSKTSEAIFAALTTLPSSPTAILSCTSFTLSLSHCRHLSLPLPCAVGFHLFFRCRKAYRFGRSQNSPAKSFELLFALFPFHRLAHIFALAETTTYEKSQLGSFRQKGQISPQWHNLSGRGARKMFVYPILERVGCASLHFHQMLCSTGRWVHGPDLESIQGNDGNDSRVPQSAVDISSFFPSGVDNCIRDWSRKVIESRW